MGFSDFWLQFNNKNKEQLNDIGHGVRKEQIDKKFQNVFDAYDTNNDGTLEDAELQQIFGHLKNLSGDNILDTSENKAAASIFAEQAGIQDVDFQGFVKSVSDAANTIISSEEKITKDGGKEIKTEYNDGTTETIAYYPNGDVKWKKVDKLTFDTVYIATVNGTTKELTKEEYEQTLKELEKMQNQAQKNKPAKTAKDSGVVKLSDSPSLLESNNISISTKNTQKKEHKEYYFPRYILESLGVDINSEEGKKILERMSYLPQEALEQIKDGAELKDVLSSNDLPLDFDNISNVLELMYGVTLRNEEEYEASKPQREKIIQQIQTVTLMSELYARVAEFNDTYTDNQGLFGLGCEGLGYLLNKVGIQGENHYQWADSCREFIEKINNFKVLNPAKFEQEFKELTGKEKFNIDALQKMVELSKNNNALDEEGNYTEEFKQAVKDFSNFDVTNINARAWYHPDNLLNGFGEALIMIVTLGWGAETKAGQVLATSLMSTFSKAGVAIASKQINNKLLQGALRFSGQAVKLLGPAINEGTKMYTYTAVMGTASNIANRAIKYDSEDNTLDKFLQTEAMVLDSAKGSFGFGAFAGAFGSTVTQKVMQRASGVSQKVGTALADKFSKGAVDANEAFTTILEKSAPTKIAEVAAFATDVLGFTAFESVLAIVKNLDNFPDGYSVEDLTNIIWEELKNQGYNLGQIKIVAWLLSSRSARMQASKYMLENPLLKGVTIERVSGDKDGYKINLPDGRKIECKNTTEMIASLQLMSRGETAFSGKFDTKIKSNKAIMEFILTKSGIRKKVKSNPDFNTEEMKNFVEELLDSTDIEKISSMYGYKSLNFIQRIIAKTLDFTKSIIVQPIVLKIINEIISNEQLYKNKNIRERMIDLIRDPYKREVYLKLLEAYSKNPKYYQNSHIPEYITHLLFMTDGAGLKEIIDNKESPEYYLDIFVNLNEEQTNFLQNFIMSSTISHSLDLSILKIILNNEILYKNSYIQKCLSHCLESRYILAFKILDKLCKQDNIAELLDSDNMSNILESAFRIERDKYYSGYEYQVNLYETLLYELMTNPIFSKNENVSKHIGKIVENSEGYKNKIEIMTLYKEKWYSDEEVSKYIGDILISVNAENKDFIIKLIEDKNFPNKDIAKITQGIRADNIEFATKLCADNNFPKEYIANILSSINKYNIEFATKLCADNNFPREDIASILSSINKYNIELATKLCADKNFPKEYIASILRNINEYKDERVNKYNIELVTKLCADNNFPKEYIASILRKVNEYRANIELTLYADNNFQEENIASMLKNVNEYQENIELVIKLCTESNFPREDIASILKRVNEYNIELATKLCADNNFPREDIASMLQLTDEYNIELVTKLCADNNFPREYIASILKNVNKYQDNIELAIKLCADNNFPKEDIPSILEVTYKNNTEIAIKLCTDKSIQYSMDMIIKVLKFMSKINVDIENLSFGVKMNLLSIISVTDKAILEVCRKYSDIDIDAKISKLTAMLGKKREVIIISPEQQNLFMQFIANNNTTLENILKTFNFEKYGKEGLPLKYTRSEFTTNIENLIKDLSPEEQNVILNHFGLIRGEAGFDGLPNNKVFNMEDASPQVKEIAQKVLTEIENFTSKNQVMTGNSKVDSIINRLIQGLPEFTSVVGKKQHGTHAYSVDIHTLKVLQSAMNNPLYEGLSDVDKTILKIAAICHDFGKRGGVVDSGHASTSAEYVIAILNKFKLPKTTIDRIIDIVDNHHWFEEYNKGKATAEDVAVRCRRPEDFVIYEILAKADFENVNETFHIENSNGVNNQAEFDRFMQMKMKAIDEALALMYSKSNLVFDTQFMQNGEKFPKQIIEIDGEQVELKVLNFNELDNNENLQQYGFSTGVTKKSARFIVHMTNPSIKDLETVIILTQNTLHQSAWSTSLIKASNNRTYRDRKFGFIFDIDQANISEANYENIGSGTAKGIESFKSLLFDAKGEERTYVKDSLINELEKKGIYLNSDEYAALTRFLVNKKYTTQITKDVKIGDKVIKAKVLIKCLENSRDSLFEGGNIHNEIVSINPRVKGLIAKVKRLAECPTEFLLFAKEHNLPIILMKPTYE